MSQYRRPKLIKPAGVIRERSSLIEALITYAQYIHILIKTLIISTFFAGISSFIGLHSYEVYKANPNTLIDVLDIIFRQTLLDAPALRVTVLSSLIFAAIFHGEYVNRQIMQIEEKTSPLPRFFAGLTIIVWVDVHLLKMDIYHLSNNAESYSDEIMSIFFPQAVSICAILIMLPLFKKMLNLTSINLQLSTIGSETKKYMRYFRYYGSYVLLIFVITNLSAIKINDEVFNFSGIEVPIALTGIFLAVFGFALLFIYPPKSVGLPRDISFLRFAMGILCFLGVGFFYSHFSNVEIYLTHVGVALIFSWMSTSIIALIN